MASFTTSPATIVKSSTGNVITLVGTSTAWVSGVTVFTLSGGTGASITSQTITSTTAATVTVTAGSATGTLTISDGLGNSQTIEVVTATNFSYAASGVVCTAPTTTTSSGGHTAVTPVTTGASSAYEYRGSFTGTGITMEAFISTPTSAIVVYCSIDGGTAFALAGNNAWGTVTIATGLTDTLHTFVLHVEKGQFFLFDNGQSTFPTWTVTGASPAMAAPVGYPALLYATQSPSYIQERGGAIWNAVSGSNASTRSAGSAQGAGAAYSRVVLRGQLYGNINVFMYANNGIALTLRINGIDQAVQTIPFHPAYFNCGQLASVAPTGGGGSGYSNGTTATCSGGSATTQATISVQVSGGVITGFTVLTPGVGYLTAPTITLANTGGGTGSGGTATITVPQLGWQMISIPTGLSSAPPIVMDYEVIIADSGNNYHGANQCYLGGWFVTGTYMVPLTKTNGTQQCFTVISNGDSTALAEGGNYQDVTQGFLWQMQKLNFCDMLTSAVGSQFISSFVTTAEYSGSEYPLNTFFSLVTTTLKLIIMLVGTNDANPVAVPPQGSFTNSGAQITAITNYYTDFINLLLAAPGSANILVLNVLPTASYPTQVGQMQTILNNTLTSNFPTQLASGRIFQYDGGPGVPGYSNAGNVISAPSTSFNDGIIHLIFAAAVDLANYIQPIVGPYIYSYPFPGAFCNFPGDAVRGAASGGGLSYNSYSYGHAVAVAGGN